MNLFPEHQVNEIEQGYGLFSVYLPCMRRSAALEVGIEHTLRRSNLLNCDDVGSHRLTCANMFAAYVYSVQL